MTVETKKIKKKGSNQPQELYGTRFNGTMVTAPSRKELGEKLKKMRTSCR